MAAPCPMMPFVNKCIDGSTPILETNISGCQVQKCPGGVVDPNGNTPNGTIVCWTYTNPDVFTGVVSGNVTGTIVESIDYTKYGLGTRYLIKRADTGLTQWVDSTGLTIGQCNPVLTTNPAVSPTCSIDSYKIPLIGCVKKTTTYVGGIIGLVGLYFLVKRKGL